jgi:hypothetical protein
MTVREVAFGLYEVGFDIVEGIVVASILGAAMILSSSVLLLSHVIDIISPIAELFR